MHTKQRIIVKIGTSSITNADGTVNISAMEHVADDIARLMRDGHEVILVTSGAVGTGKSIVLLRDTPDEIAQKQVLAAVGQAALIGEYGVLFRKQGVTPAQILVTKEDFRDTEHCDNMRRCFDALLHERILPVVNENDTTAITELMFTDNDELTALVATLMRVDHVIMLTTVNGVLGRDGSVIPRIDQHAIAEVLQSISSDTSSGGRGGMKSKIHAAERLIQARIPMAIVNAKTRHVIYDVAHGHPIGTTIAYTPQKEAP